MNGTIDPTKYPLFTADQLAAAQANMQEAADSVGLTDKSITGVQGGVAVVSLGYIDATSVDKDGHLVPYYVDSRAPFAYVQAKAALGAGYSVLQKPMNGSGSIIEARHQYLEFMNDVLGTLGLKPFPLNLFKTAFVFNQY